jgi:hypothetical protein
VIGTAIKTAADLWPELISRAGLTGASKGGRDVYDHELIDSLCSKLFPADRSKTPIKALLQRSKLSAEALIRAFFATLAPFAAMKVDILTMLTDAGAKGSGDALRIRFNFDPKREPLDLLLSEFREQMESVTEITVERPLLTLPKEPWAIPRAGVAYRDGFPTRGESSTTPGLSAWLTIYTSNGLFEALPDDWRTGQSDVDERLGRVVQLTNTVLSAFRRYAANHEELRLAASEEGRRAIPDPIEPSVQQLWQIESDYWPKAIVNWIEQRRHDVRVKDEAALQRMMAAIDTLLPPSSETELVSELVRQLEDVLNLPIWRYRHEVYAVWLGSQIHHSLKSLGWRFQFHLRDDRLEFAFRGVHLATMFGQTDEQVLFWWTELETPHQALPSGHRTSAIKPDYRIRRAPLSDADADILVVEAKQNLKSATREFTNAVRDYAFGCPRAEVLLANYGPIALTALSQVEPGLQDRIELHARVHPGELAKVSAFRMAIADAVTAAVGLPKRQRLEYPVEVRLTWSASPRDLDLHVLREGPITGHAYYSQRDVAGVHLSDDVQAGHGPEIAEIEPSDATYLVAVHQFSLDGELSASQAKVSFRGIDSDPSTFDVPRGKSGRWWRVARIDMVAGSITAINTLDDAPIT